MGRKNAQKAQRNGEKLDRITGLTEIIEVFGRVKTVLVSRKDVQKGALFVINTPKMFKKLAFMMQNNAFCYLPRTNFAQAYA